MRLNLLISLMTTLAASSAYAQPQRGGRAPAAATAATPIANTPVVVRMVDGVDSSRARANQTYRATVVNPVAIGSVQVAANTAATIQLTQIANQWTLTLTSLAQAGAVTGGSPSVQGSAGGAAGAAVSQIASAVGGRRPAQKTTPAAAATPATTLYGARVYVPAGTNVQFVVTAAASAAPATAATNPALANAATAANTAAAGRGAAPAAGAAPAQPGQPAATTAAGAPAAPAAAAASATPTTTILWKNIQYQLTGCQRQSPHVICTVQITNTGNADAALFAGRSFYIDQAGNKVFATSQQVANCRLAGAGPGCPALPGVAMAGTFTFVDENGAASSLVRLELVGRGETVAQFQAVPVK